MIAFVLFVHINILEKHMQENLKLGGHDKLAYGKSNLYASLSAKVWCFRRLETYLENPQIV